MNESPIRREDDAARGPFDPRFMLFLVLFGSLAFAAVLLLSAYAPDLRSGRDGGAHALSNAATGYSALVRLAEATGRNPEVVRSEDMLNTEDLAVITPNSGYDDLSAVLEARGQRTTLYVMPKWMTKPDPKRRGWVVGDTLLPAADPAAILAPGWPVKVERHRGGGRPLVSAGPIAPSAGQFRAPAILQTISGDKLKPIIADRDGRIVLAALQGSPLYILSDPDLLNNKGLKDKQQAAAALSLLDELNSTGAEGILFDVTANGLGRTRSPLKLAFDPPFLAVTLTIVAAMLLSGWQAAVRFGAPRRPERALAFGKGALVDNSAALIRRAGREASLGERYADLIRQRAAIFFRLPPGLGSSDQDRLLDRARPERPFTSVATATAAARSRAELLASARRMHDWIKEMDA